MQLDIYSSQHPQVGEFCHSSHFTAEGTERSVEKVVTCPGTHSEGGSGRAGLPLSPTPDPVFFTPRCRKGRRAKLAGCSLHPPAVWPSASHLPSLGLRSLRRSEQGPFQFWSSVSFWIVWVCKELETSAQLKKQNTQHERIDNIACYFGESEAGGIFERVRPASSALVFQTGRPIITAFEDTLQLKSVCLPQ